MMNFQNKVSFFINAFAVTSLFSNEKRHKYFQIVQQQL